MKKLEYFWLIMAGIFLSIAIYMSISAVTYSGVYYIFPPVCLYMWWYRRKQRKKQE